LRNFSVIYWFYAILDQLIKNLFEVSNFRKFYLLGEKVLDTYVTIFSFKKAQVRLNL